MKMTINFRRLFIALIFLSAATIAAKSQTIVSASLNGKMSPQALNQQISKLYPKGEIAKTDLELRYDKVVYRSTDENGRPTELTGLVVMPTSGAPKGIVVYYHGTSVYKKDHPSNYIPEEKIDRPYDAIIAFATGGYALAMPDYIGQGRHDGYHPYPANRVNAKSGIDMIAVTRELAGRNKIKVGNKIFVTGYSEGGGVAMAAAKDLTEGKYPQYKLEKAAPASGPYDLSGTTRKFILQEGIDAEGFYVRLYLSGFMLKYFSATDKIKIDDYVKGTLGFTIKNSFDGKLEDEEIVKRLVVSTLLVLKKSSIRVVLKEDFLTALLNDDRNDPVVKMLHDNDVYDWRPKSPTLIINLSTDKVVDPANSKVAFEAMTKRGAGRKVVRRYVFDDASLNHMTASAPSMAVARKFFDEGFAAVLMQK